MEPPLFADKARQPVQKDLVAALGKTATHWQVVLAAALASAPGAATKWTFSGAKYGWALVVKDRRRNLIHLKPQRAGFTASFAFREEAAGAIENSGLPAALIHAFASAPKYTEGRPIRVEVRKAADVAAVKTLLSIKAAS